MATIATQQQAVEWYKIVADWPNFWGNFQKNYQGLLAQHAFVQRHPKLFPEWEAQVKKGAEFHFRLNAVNESIRAIRSSWDTFTGWLKGTFGMSGLGILPAIPVALSVATAISLITGATVLLKNWSEMATRYSIIQAEEAKGATPEQAVKIAETVVGKSGSPGTLFGINIKWLLIGGAAILLLPSILPMLQGRK